jgi:hypothetical protein
MLEAVKSIVRERMKEKEVEQRLCLFSRRDIREATGWSYMQTKRHLERLSELEYLAARHGRNGSAFHYELLVDAHEPEGAWQVGLIDPAKLRKSHAYSGNLNGQTGDLTKA